MSHNAVLDVGELYRPDDLPENVMTGNDDVQWLSDDYAYLADENHYQYTFEVFDRVTIEKNRVTRNPEDRFYRCVKIERVTNDGAIEPVADLAAVEKQMNND